MHTHRYSNTILAQYKKVKRVRNKFQCELIAGIADIDGKTMPFTKCDAIWEF